MLGVARVYFKFFCVVCIELLLLRAIFAVTYTVSDILSKGKDGTCQSPSSSRTNQYSCQSRWSSKTSLAGAWRTIPIYPTCKYRVLLEIQKCYEPSRQGEPPKEVCIRTKKIYVVNKCRKKWLNWEPCTKPCGGGYTIRYKFDTRIYSEQRECNLQICPYWTQWETTQSTCYQNCTRTWKRDCRNGTGIQSPSLCNGNVSDATENRPCPVKMCKNFVEILPSTLPSPTTVFQTTYEYTTDTATNSNESVLSINPRINIGEASDDGLNKDKAPPDEAAASNPNALIWIGVVVGILVLCILILLSYIGMQKRRKKKQSGFSFGTVHTSLSQRSSSTGNNTAAASQQQAQASYQATSIDRMIARLRDMHQAATIRRTPPNNNVYLQPNVVTPSALLPDSNGQQQQYQLANTKIHTAQAQNLPAFYSPADTSSSTGQNGDPIYADIPAYCRTSRDDSFTSDSEDFDMLDNRPFQPPPTSSQVALKRGGGSFMGHPSQDVQRPMLRRSETERRIPPAVAVKPTLTFRHLQNEPKVKSLPNHASRDDPVDPVSQHRKLARGNSFPIDHSMSRPPRPTPLMQSLKESSQEDLSNMGIPHSSSTPIQCGNEPTLYLKPTKRPASKEIKTEALSNEISSSKVRTGSDSSQHTTPPPVALRNARCAGGAVSAEHEFGFQRRPPSGGGFSDVGSPRSRTSSNSINPEQYREPADANRPTVEEAYSTYNIPFHRADQHLSQTSQRATNQV